MRKNTMILRGGVPLRGAVPISGSKNSALPCLFATLLTDEECLLDNVPDLDDIDTTCRLLSVLGKKVERAPKAVRVSRGRAARAEAPYELVRRMRASALVLGPILARRGHAAASLPGGCAIGNRPIDIHLSGFKSLGARTEIREGIVHVQARRLVGKRIRLAFPSVGATENLLMAAARARGRTVLENAAREPEIVDCADFLNAMGGRITGQGTDRIVIEGTGSLHGARHTVIPDRIETATYLIAAAATRGRLRLEGTRSDHLTSVLECLARAGAQILIEKKVPSGPESITIQASRPLRTVSVATGPYPEFPTDVQAQWMALMSLTPGQSLITETIFENRFLHAAELRRMGASIEIHGRTAQVEGVRELSGASVMISDLRAGAAMVIAGLAARGRTTIHRLYHLDRGYEDLEEKLKDVGARVRRV